MLRYLIRRSLIGLLTLSLITFIIYALIRQMPGNPATAQIAEMGLNKRITEEDMERINRSYGLDKPWHQGYMEWVRRLLTRRDLGRSFTHKKPVYALINERVGPTLLLSLTSLMLSYVLAGPLGLYSVVRANRTDERIMSTFLFMIYSLPTFVAALALLYFFYQRLGWLPLRGMSSENFDSMSPIQKLLDVGWHMILPVTCFTYGSLAYYARFIRSNMQEVIRQDYIRTARAKGVHPLFVVVRHAFRNTMIPMVTQLGLTLPTLLGGSVILEQIFTWPGMGRLFFESINTRDYPVIMGLTLIFSLLTLMGQLLADVLYAVVDPRIKLE
ncbi:MAG: dppB [Planctomycetaceae bacterium]|nr:dppB [Planctomycetaceae bacterium]